MISRNGENYNCLSKLESIIFKTIINGKQKVNYSITSND